MGEIITKPTNGTNYIKWFYSTAEDSQDAIRKAKEDFPLKNILVVSRFSKELPSFIDRFALVHPSHFTKLHYAQNEYAALVVNGVYFFNGYTINTHNDKFPVDKLENLSKEFPIYVSLFMSDDIAENDLFCYLDSKFKKDIEITKLPKLSRLDLLKSSYL